jgi:uncharacterized membrane protein
MELSYAQNLEDYHLSLAFAGQTTGTYIDVGAGHPIADNVSFWFYERGWQGIVVEPQPETLRRCTSGCVRAMSWFVAWSDVSAAKSISMWWSACMGSRRQWNTLRKKQKPSALAIRPFACR